MKEEDQYRMDPHIDKIEAGDLDGFVQWLSDQKDQFYGCDRQLSTRFMDEGFDRPKVSWWDEWRTRIRKAWDALRGYYE